MKRSEFIKSVLGDGLTNLPRDNFVAEAYAPSNIALCKYWGKRDQELNLPLTSSLSISLDRGSRIKLSVSPEDEMTLNGQPIALASTFGQRLLDFVNLFRTENKWHFKAEIQSDIPVGAGLASSACGFAALALALDQLFNWQLDKKSLSLLARLGSGSACRSIWNGFVEWHAGDRPDGMDSHGEPISDQWSDLRLGLLIVSESAKPLSSRAAMQRTVKTSVLYRVWPEKVSKDLAKLKKAIHEKDFVQLGQTAESNALAMHATMLTAHPAIQYSLPETLAMMEKIWQLREDGLSVFFTQDAGPNLKLLFLERDILAIQQCFPKVGIVRIF